MRTTKELTGYLSLIEQNLGINPTFIYNEGWMLRLVLQWFSVHKNIEHCLSIKEGRRWYSEAKLSSQFLATQRGDKQAESYTTADAVYGDIVIGNEGKTDVKLNDSCRQFVVVESKMSSSYSEGITNAPTYNQAARTVACMSKVIALSGQPVATIGDIAFYTLAPKSQIAKVKTFQEFTDVDHIRDTVQNRIADRADAASHQKWHDEYFEPLLSKIKIELISWEDVIDFITKQDSTSGSELSGFYTNCLRYNKV
jgi:hypothetical protein